MYETWKLKPKVIREKVLKSGVNINTSNISAIIHRGKSLKSSQTTTEMNALCESLSLANEDVLIKLEIQNQKPRICITHKGLINAFRAVNNLHIDATYKLIVLGYPVIIIGITDTNKHFYFLAVCICELESTNSYVWCIETLKEFYRMQGFI
ncbi:hypothetical protein ENBRE01_3432 [Enteropsectra breve]|nr:hypothetical protein ENBRE01_3432 [Enteropsectra breve]